MEVNPVATTERFCATWDYLISLIEGNAQGTASHNGCNGFLKGNPMSHVAHELHAEFSEHTDFLHEMKVKDAHFQRISEHYHDVNREIHRIEAQIEAATDERLEDLKKQRLAMLDEVAGMIVNAKAA